MLLSERRAVPPRRRRRKMAASIAIATLFFTLTPERIAYQDLGALLARQPEVAARWHRHLIASPFGTIHAAVFNLPNPIGTIIPRAPTYALVSFDPTDITGSINRPSLADATTQFDFPKSNGRAKHDLLIARPRQSMPPLLPLNSQFKLATVPDDKVSTTEMRGVAPVAFNTPVLAPVAFVRFCAQYPEDCKRRSPDFDQTTPVSLTKARIAELSKINREVNLSIQPQENRGGVLAEQWLVAPGRGDCNDYAVTKRHELLARGWPSRSLLLAEVVTASGEHHLVLVVRTREADLVLDNLNWNIRPVSQIEYQWVRAQQVDNPKFWSAINMERINRVAREARLGDQYR